MTKKGSKKIMTLYLDERLQKWVRNNALLLGVSNSRIVELAIGTLVIMTGEDARTPVERANALLENKVNTKL
jgi:hypothetical protein